MTAQRRQTSEVRATAVAVRWRLGCSRADAFKVAALVEPVEIMCKRRSATDDGMVQLGPVQLDRVQVVARMPDARLLALARQAGVK